MREIHQINNHFLRKYQDMKDHIVKQEKLIEEVKKAFLEKDTYTLPLETTVKNLIEHGISKPEILTITEIPQERYEEIVNKNKSYQLPYVLLNAEEIKEFDSLMHEIQAAKDINQLIDSINEEQRIAFIHGVLRRYQKEYDNIRKSNNRESYEDLISQFTDKLNTNLQAERTYISLVRIFGNEIKRKREEVLIKISDP